MRQDVVGEAAAALLAAYNSREAIEALTAKYEDLTFDEAYEIQRIQVARRQDGGRIVRGHKVGLTSKVMQRSFGVEQPDYGHLFDDMFYSEFVPISPRNFLQPRVEPEIAFVLDKPLNGPGVTAADVANAVGMVVPALEIIDSRIRDWNIKFFDTIADNASSGGVVLGSKPTRLAEVDLRLVGCNLTRNGRLEETGAGGAVLGSPLVAVQWLANTLGELGIGLEAGHVVLPGSCTRTVPFEPGDTVTATFGGHLGSVTATMGKVSNT
jgi:2-keto-4-pentenoate hydratase